MTACARLGEGEQAQQHMKRFQALKAEDLTHLKDRNRVFDDLGTIQGEAARTCLAAANLYWAQGQTDVAEAYYRQVRQLADRSPEVLGRLASVHRRAGRLDQALAIRQRIVELRPDDAMNRFNLGGLHLTLQELDPAEAAFEAVCQAAPRFSGGFRELARVYLLQGRRLDRACRSDE